MFSVQVKSKSDRQGLLRGRALGIAADLDVVDFRDQQNCAE